MPSTQLGKTALYSVMSDVLKSAMHILSISFRARRPVKLAALALSEYGYLQYVDEVVVAWLGESTLDSAIGLFLSSSSACNLSCMTDKKI